MKPFDIKKARQGFLNKGKNPIEKLLRVSLDLFDAQQTGILYGTNQTRIKCLPSSTWDRGIMDAFDGYGPRGLLLRLLGKYIVTAKKMSPVFFYNTNLDGEKQDSYGVIAYVLRNCADYYKKGISVIICPDTQRFGDQNVNNYYEIPFYVYDGHQIRKSREMILADFRIVRQFQSRNSIYIYLPDYGILVLNTANDELLEIQDKTFVNEKDLLERLDFLIEIVNLASLENLETLRGKKKAELLWRKENHLQAISRKLKENEKKYRDLYQTAPIAYISMDTKGNILNCNQRAQELSGYNKKDLLGRNVDSFILKQSEKSTIVDEIKETLRKGHRVKELQTQMKPYLRDPVWVSFSLEPVKDQDGNIHELRAMILDISERRILEKQLFQTQKLEGVGRFSGGIAHDFNNILSPISGYIEMMQMGAKKKDLSHSQMNTILECVNHAKKLVSQMLTFSRQNEQILKPIEASKAVEESMLLIRASLPSTIKLQKKIEVTNALIMADSIQIYQLIVNLTTRAFQAIGDESGTIGIRLSKADDHHVQARQMKPGPNGVICLSIEDDGDAIDPGTFDKLFDPYFLAKNQKSNSGISLSMVHGIVESHHGRIAIENRNGKGNRFDIFFPIYSYDQTSSSTDKKDASDNESIRAGTEKILLVDDDKKIIDMLAFMFEKLGYRVHCFQEPFKAIEYFKQHPQDFDIVITDQTMPGITGSELANHIALIQPDLPVILCSGIGEGLETDKFKSPSIKGFLKKPIGVKAVSDLFVQLLDQSD